AGAGKPGGGKAPLPTPNNPHNKEISITDITAGHSTEQNDYGIYQDGDAAAAANRLPSAEQKKPEAGKKQPNKPGASQPGKKPGGKTPASTTPDGKKPDAKTPDGNKTDGKNLPSTVPGAPALDKPPSIEKKIGDMLEPYLPTIKPIEFQWPGVLKPDEFPTAAGGRLPASISSIQENRKDNNFVDRTKAKPCQKV
ncbi:hypothetical protein CPT77_02410, partial [Snodgrassella alvi]